MLHSKSKFHRQNDGENDNEADISPDDVANRDVFAVSDDQLPDGDHSPVLLAHVPVVVEDAGHMAMAIVTADVMHALPVSRVTPLDVLIEFAELRTVDVQKDVLVSLSKREVIL